MAESNAEKKLDYKADTYSIYRKDIPDEVISKIISCLKEKYKGPLDIAVDVGCGSGQGTFPLGPLFKKVYGIDNLESQIKEAESTRKLDNIEYSVAPSEILSFADNSVQLITASTSIHWFDLDVFFPEARRVLCNNGILAAYAYLHLKPLLSNPDRMMEVDALFEEHVKNLSPYTFERAKMCYEEYKTMEFPFEEVIRDVKVRNSFRGHLSDVIGHAMTHSAMKRAQDEHPEIAQEIKHSFEKKLCEIVAKENISPNDEITVYRDFFMVICRKLYHEQ